MLIATENIIYIYLEYVRRRKKEIDTIPFVLLGLRLEQVVVGALESLLPSFRVARVIVSHSPCVYQSYLVM